MPTYEYQCTECHRPFDLKATVSEYEQGLNSECPWCGSEQTQRVFSAAFVASGSSASSASFDSMPSGASCGCGSGCGCN